MGGRHQRRLKGVKKWLDSPASGDWIMVIDNFDAVDLYLSVERGAILYTTRNQPSEIVHMCRPEQESVSCYER